MELTEVELQCFEDKVINIIESEDFWFQDKELGDEGFVVDIRENNFDVSHLVYVLDSLLEKGVIQQWRYVNDGVRYGYINIRFYGNNESKTIKPYNPAQ